MLLDVLWDVKEALNVPQSVIRLTLIDLTVQLALTCAVRASLIHRNLLRASIARWLSALIVTSVVVLEELSQEESHTVFEVLLG